MLVSSCQTEPKGSPPITTVIERSVLIDSMCQAVKPIKPSRQDVLTSETEEAIGDHNNAFWCACEASRPPEFDAAAICKP